ncbi:MAG: type I restriction endonuclease subunit R [Chloroflexi bacterium]|nr:type I restriction endonuclease subunit R [Chloroflexota bacterium]
MTTFTESTIEQAAIDWLKDLGYEYAFGPEIAFDGESPERGGYQEVILFERLRNALLRLNPDLPPAAREEAFRKLTRLGKSSLLLNNHAFHHMLVNGIEVDYKRSSPGDKAKDGRMVSGRAYVVDFDELENNDWLVVNQYTVVAGAIHELPLHNRRPDVVIFINGLPLAVIELKNAADENATIWSAFNQLQTYKNDIPALFHYNELLIISDGLNARIGSVTANKEWFLPWKTVEGEETAPVSVTQLEVLLRGVFEKRRLLDLIRYFIVFEQERGAPTLKKIAGYHQFHAVNYAINETIRASQAKGTAVKDLKGRYVAQTMKGGEVGDQRIGVIWHTQGSGKSLTMAFYTGRLVLHPAMENPTIIVITDRNDLDDQLFGTFSRCSEVLRQTPEQASSREDLMEKLKGRRAGGVFFTTIQKFLPLPSGEGRGEGVLSDRHNIIVIADEAHRSQYDFIDGYARHMRDSLPNASFIGFTGTPIEHTDANTRAVFGDYISIYDIQQAVEDGATVKIYYEGRLAKLELDEKEKPKIDPEFDEVTEGEELEKKEKLKTKWAALEAIVGTEKRIGLVARDFIDHFEKRLEAMDGKAMIVGMSRRICVDLYDAIIKLRPEWHSEDDKQGVIKIVMTGNATDPLDWQGHVRTKARREELAKRFKNPDDSFKIVIVRDMWLTGFDVPPLHTMYIDKPMQGHGLMQTIARVNRVYKDKPGGLIVDYLGLAHHLQTALAAYTEAGHPAETPDQNEAVNELLKRYEICKGLFYGFDWSKFFTGTAQEKLGVLPLAQEHILRLDDGKKRLLQAVRELSLAFALAVPDERAIAIRDDVSFFQAVRAALVKSTVDGERSAEDVDQAIRQILSRAVAASDQVIDIFAAAGLKKPEISILSEEFLAEVSRMPQKNLAIELLRKLLNDELKMRMKKNLVQSRSFTEMLERTIRSYQNRTLAAAEVIAELIKLGEDMREAQKRGEKLNLTEDEIAFYDALEVNDSAVQELGDDALKAIARELVETVRKNTTIDWTVRETVRAKLRVMVKRILRKYGYPPDKQEKATKTVLEQAELIARDWAG